MGLEHPAIPIEDLAPHLEEWERVSGKGFRALAARCQLDEGTVQKIVSGGHTTKTVNGVKKKFQKKFVSFPVADIIITHGLGNPFLWWEDPNLRKQYEKGITPNSQDLEILEGTKGTIDCNDCGESLPPTEFYLHRSKSNNRAGNCKACYLKRRRARKVEKIDSE